MAISEKIEKAINEQIKEEFYSSYLYLAMSAWLSERSLNGFANWMYVQYQEEISHAIKFFKYLIERGGKVELQEIAKPKNDFESVLAIYQQALEHEKFVTSRINNMVDIAREVKDNATLNMLQWFVDEQVEEEANASELVDRLELVSSSKSALFMLDKELAGRTFVDATVN